MFQLEKKTLEEKDILVNESLFSLGNGYLGARGNIDELGSPSVRGTYINGFYDEIDHLYSEKLYGFPEISQRQINVIEGQFFDIYLDDEKIDLLSDQVVNYKQSLDLEKGCLTRVYDYQTQSGKGAKVNVCKFISQVEKPLLLIHGQVDYDGEIKIVSKVDTQVLPLSDDSDPRVGSHNHQMLRTTNKNVEETLMSFDAETVKTNLKLKVFCDHETSGSKDVKDSSTLVITSRGALTFTKYLLYYSSRHYDFEKVDFESEVKRVKVQSFSQHLADQEAYLREFWSESDIQIEGDEKSQLGIRYSLYQLLQSVGKDGMTNISAKGLTGEGYEGHTFWDTEIYIIPSLLMSRPDWVRSLLVYRYGLIDESRKRAKELGHKRGIKFPWRTITGPECSAYFPAGTAQYHINGDIAYSIIQYYQVTKDDIFMRDYGLEMLLETALLWLDMGHFSHKGFCIDAVTGPDEYSCVVDNNYYTNAICQYQMRWMNQVINEIHQLHHLQTEDLLHRIGITKDDRILFDQVAKDMYLPFDQEKNIHLQDDRFLEKKLWDFENTPKENYPLLLHYHPLTIYRHQVLKQADTVLAHFMMEEGIDESIIRDSYHYYHPITTHDSSLSASVYAMMATRIGEYDDAFERFEDSLMLDLENRHGNTKDGLHFANIGGTVMMIEHGFLGMRIHENGLHFRPWLPDEWQGISLKLKYQGRVFKVELKKGNLTFGLLSGQPIDVFVFNEKYSLNDKLNILF